VAAAVELLDSDGLDGLNMRALGQQLGTAAKATYWHIKTKDELVQLAGTRSGRFRCVPGCVRFARSDLHLRNRPAVRRH